MRIGYQLSSITPHLQNEADLRSSLKKLVALGYCDVQLQGTPMSMKPETVADALHDAGLNCIALQADWPDGFGAEPEKYIDLAAACGAKYLTFAVLPRDVTSVEALEAFAEAVSEVHKTVTDAGLVFAFHPIGPDFRLMDGKPVYERLMDQLPASTQLTFCVHSTFGTDVHYKEVLQKYAGRVDLVHFKDSVLLPDGKAQLMPLGAGRTDWQPVADACRAADVKWIFAEQERWQKDAFECAADSLNYLNTLNF